MITTTLAAIRSGRLGKPCRDGWSKLLRHLGKTGADDEPLFVATVLDSNGIGDAVWVLDAIGNERVLRLWACDCAERALPMFERERPADARPRRAIETARRFANGEATEAELNAAWAAAPAAARAAAGAAARDAAGAAANNAASDAAWAAAGAAASDAAWAAAWAAEREWQAGRLRWYLEGEGE